MTDPLAVLIGETLSNITGLSPGSEEIAFTTESGRIFKMFHEQDCCESVVVDEIIGDPDALLGGPLLISRTDSNEGPELKDAESYTWTFYTLGTVKGVVVIRWLGQSNGYYSERVDFEEIS